MKELNEISYQLKEIEKTFKRPKYPASVLIETTARCNAKCIQCYHSKMRRPKGDMDLDLAKKIIDDIAENALDTVVWFSFYGEPLLIGEKLGEMIAYAKQKGIINTYINTNGMLLTEDMADMLIDSGLDNIIVGIDGFSKEVCEGIRLGTDRDVIYKNVLGLSKRMKEKKSSTPRIQAQFIVMDENEQELTQYMEFWQGNNIALRIRPRGTWAGNVSVGSNINPEIERIACGFSSGIVYVFWDGRVPLCGNDVDGLLVLADVNDLSIQEIWDKKNSTFVDYHFYHEFDKLPEYCQKCFDWQTIGTVDYNEKGERAYRKYGREED